QPHCPFRELLQIVATAGLEIIEILELLEFGAKGGELVAERLGVSDAGRELTRLLRIDTGQLLAEPRLFGSDQGLERNPGFDKATPRLEQGLGGLRLHHVLWIGITEPPRQVGQRPVELVAFEFEARRLAELRQIVTLATE